MPSTNTTITSTNNSGNEKEWPVQLYRYTESDGWQKQQVALSKRLAAAPRKDCIVVPALRQKFSLCSTDESNSFNNNKSCVIRRDKCILLVSRRRIRAMVLQFASLQECLEFSDRFVALNPPPPPPPPLNTADTTTVPQPAAGLAEQEEVVSHVARLLHDQDFLGFVNKLEDYLANSTDGAKILEGLEQRR
jgi:hypothetical protein